MKTQTRLVALLLALVMVISCAPLGIFAADDSAAVGESVTVNPIADTYVSAVSGEEAAVFGSSDKILIDNQHTYFVTFKASDFGNTNRAVINLPVTGTGKQTLSVYLLDGYRVDEAALCYNNAPALTEDMLIAKKEVTEGNSEIELIGLMAMVEGEYFTLAVKGSAQYYKLDFEQFSANSQIKAYNAGSNPQPADAPGGDDCYTENYVWRTGGATGAMNVVNNPDGSADKVAKVVSGQTYNRIRWYNTFVRDKAYLDGADLGKVFDISFDLRISAPANGGTLKLSYALDSTGGTLESYKPTPEADTWTTYTKTFNLDESLLFTNGELTKRGLLSFTLSGAVGSTYYFDDITVIERAPTALASKEAGATTVINSITVDESGAVSDTYVSARQPGVAFGNADELVLNGGDDESIIFATYSRSLIKDGKNLVLTFPAVFGDGVEAEILLLDGYYVNESTLTYNTMPDLDEAVSLGKFELGGNATAVEIEDATKLVKSPYFTIALRTDDNLEIVYLTNFEDYAIGTDVNTYKNDVNDTATNSEGVAYKYYYTHVAAGKNIIPNFARQGGSLSNLGNILADPDGSGNHTVNVVMSTNSSSVWAGRTKFYNTISDSELTKDSPLVGTTFRFYAKVKAGNEAAITNKCTATASAMLSLGGDALKDANGKAVKSADLRVSNEWQTITVDYTLRAEDIKVDSITGTQPVWAYPSFTIDYSNQNASNQFLIDDLVVVKLDADGKESRLVFTSSEGAESAGDSISVKARNAKQPVADTYISESDKTAVHGFDSTLRADNRNTYLATFKTADFRGAEGGYLYLPISGENSQTISVYFMDGFRVDEATTNYNNTPALTADMLVETRNVTAGEHKININDFISEVTGEYFTIAVKGSAHSYKMGFEQYATGNSGDFTVNVADSVETDRMHMYGFASEADITNGASYRFRRGGNFSARKIAVEGDGKILTLKSHSTDVGWAKIMNALNYEIADLAGKTFVYSAKVRLDTAASDTIESASSKPWVSIGIGGSGENKYYSSQTKIEYNVLKDNDWHVISGEYTVKSSDIGKKIDSQWDPKKRISYPMLCLSYGVPSYNYSTDDILVYEVAPTEIGSLESESGTAYIATATDVIADTYVSKAHPDTCYGGEAVLRLGDKNGDKKATVISFLNDVLDDRYYVDLNLENKGDEIKDVYVYYVLDYMADEASLTWNTMPEYENNLLGVYNIGKGGTQIDLSALKGKLTGDCFTLVLRTENHTYYEDFESDSVGTTVTDNTYDNTVTEGNMKYYHAFSDKVYYPDGKYIISRRNGVLDTRVIVADKENSDNNVLNVYTAKDQSYDGNVKLYNSLNDSLITKDSDIVGKTFRFTASVKFDAEHSNPDKLSRAMVTIGALTSVNNKYRSSKTEAKYNAIKDGWATVSVDYTVSADHIREEGVSDGAYSYPMFGLYFTDDGLEKGTNTYMAYFVDNLSVVEVVDGVAVGDAELGSREGGKGVYFVSALCGRVTVIEATASGRSNGDVISIVDGNNTYSLLRAEAGKLMFGNTALCDELGNDYVLGNDSVKVVAIYDDKTGEVRFAVGDFLAYYKEGGEIKATFGHKLLEGGLSFEAVFGESGIKASPLDKLTSEIIGTQINEIDRSVRFVSGVDAIYYNAAGFLVEKDGSGAVKRVGSPTIYSAVTANDKLVYATEYGYEYMAALVIKDVKNGGVVKVTPYLRVGSNFIYGESVFYKITTKGGLAVTETNESEFKAATNANLAAIRIDGAEIAAFDPDVTGYNVPAADPQSFAVEAIPAESDATVAVAKNGNTAVITVTGYDGISTKTYTVTAFDAVGAEVVNKNGADAIVTYVFDDGDTSSATIVTKVSEKYPSITGSFALVTDKLATLNTIDGVEGDGLLEYQFDENGNYVYTKIESKWNYWVDLFAKYPNFEGVNHTHTHAYIGENDNGGAFEYRNTAGDVFTSAVFPIGNVRKEYYASNQILRELGQRAYVMVGAGLTAGGSMIAYTDSYKALPQTSGAFIGKRATVNAPTKPDTMVNLLSDFTNEDNRFNVKAYMVQHYAASATAPKSVSAADYSREACLAAGVDYWTTYIDKAVEMGEWAAFCFHNVKADSHTGTSGHFVFESQLDAVFAHTDNLAKENKVWVASFTDACLYVFSRSTALVDAYENDDGDVVVALGHKEDKTIFTMPLTVKVTLPEGKTSAKVGGKTLETFTEGGNLCVYVDVTPYEELVVEVE